ncbi:TnsA endonuclease N-terminal domain-containing protein [Schinkia azotoformans]|uniref:TnsA endonuclease N-terminal domain-containing protein n=1 Tax=Schinkia azotoformans TaxID=1454 RepID=UPI002DBD00F0|nr:TnsA endonuclease N-terminal domain-containing protein [Schinkia azotoformans]MEC1759894.1 TnsA endonuclease N-terminal domain-containing protein [Schinkia azotoformans]
MASKSIGWTQEKLKRYLKEGRGRGAGSQYIPWTKTHEFSSIGRATRLYGLKTNRIHHLHSDNQLRAFLIFEWSDDVIDIRESYPLLDVLETIDERDDLRFDKFRDKETNEQLVLTTNFLLTLKDKYGGETYVARAVKNTSELNKKITFEKLEIERRYWEAKGVDWKIITEKQLPKVVANNIVWVRETLIDNDDTLNKVGLSTLLNRYLYENDMYPLKEVLKLFEKDQGLKKGTGLFLFRYLIAKKDIRVNMTKAIDLSFILQDLLL